MGDPKRFAEQYDPPAIGAPERAWRVWTVHWVKMLRDFFHGHEAHIGDIAQAGALRLLEHEALDRERAVVTGAAAARMAQQVDYLTAEVRDLSREVERLYDELDRICKAAGLPLPLTDEDTPPIAAGENAADVPQGGS